MGCFTDDYEDLLNLHSDDPELLKKYKKKPKRDKYIEIDNYIKDKISLMRSKELDVGKKEIEILRNEFIKSNPNTNFTFKILAYFITECIKRLGIRHKYLHGDLVDNINENEIKQFCHEFCILKNVYDDKNIFNCDETGIFIKILKQSSMFLKITIKGRLNHVKQELLLC